MPLLVTSRGPPGLHRESDELLHNPDPIIDRLKDFQRTVRRRLIDSWKAKDRHTVSPSSAADTIYAIDAVVEPVLEDFCRDWAKTTPLVLVAEGVENESGQEGQEG